MINKWVNNLHLNSRGEKLKIKRKKKKDREKIECGPKMNKLPMVPSIYLFFFNL